MADKSFASRVGNALPVTSVLANTSTFSTTFSSSGGILLVFWSATGWVSSNVTSSIQLIIDGVQKATATIGAATTVMSHKSYPAQFTIVTGLAAGSHTISVSNLSNTNIDANDRCSITIIELPT